jgi:SAM-dependent methyltransferase
MNDPSYAGAARVFRDRYLGPSLLAPFASDLATRLAPHLVRERVTQVLEIAADTGRLSVALATYLPAGATILATDPDAAAVEAGAAKSRRVQWRQADPAALPFADGQFDIIACQFGLAILPDRLQALREVRRVMAPHGRFVFSTPAPLHTNAAAECIHTTLATLFPDEPPGFLPDVLHGYADDEVIDDELTAVGFTDAMYANVDLTFIAPAHEAALGYCLGTQLRDEVVRHVGADVEPTILAVAAGLRLRFGTDPIETNMRALTVTASA